MSEQTITTLQTDSEGRIYLGDLAKGNTCFRVHTDKDQRIILEPENIPERELWLHKNADALESVMKGLQQSQSGQVSLAEEDFKTYIDDED